MILGKTKYEYVTIAFQEMMNMLSDEINDDLRTANSDLLHMDGLDEIVEYANLIDNDFHYMLYYGTR